MRVRGCEVCSFRCWLSIAIGHCRVIQTPTACSPATKYICPIPFMPHTCVWAQTCVHSRLESVTNICVCECVSYPFLGTAYIGCTNTPYPTCVICYTAAQIGKSFSGNTCPHVRMLYGSQQQHTTINGTNRVGEKFIHSVIPYS